MNWQLNDLSERQRQMIAATSDRESWLADKRIKPNMPESDFQNVIIELATLRGWDWIWHDNDARKNVAGKPDLELARVATKQFMLAELKTGNNNPRPVQQKTIDTLRMCGVTVHVWRPTDWQVVVSLLW